MFKEESRRNATYAKAPKSTGIVKDSYGNFGEGSQIFTNHNRENGAPCFLASDRLKFETIPRIYYTLYSFSISIDS